MIFREIDANSNDNTLFFTERCNNRCIMCCQPPTNASDIDKYYLDNIKRIRTAPKELPVIGITGGEPTLAGDKLISIIELIREELPNTDIHLLSNGRKFYDGDYARRVAKAAGDKLFVGIPLHSDYHGDHDLIAGVKGAFSETMQGIYNLASHGTCIELRIVINKLNYNRLPQIAEFIHKNLFFVGWTALMGMEQIGYAVKNYNDIWIEPIEYIPELIKAVDILDSWDYSVDIYNIPLCLIPEGHHKFARMSISDWKNKYLDICDNCRLRSDCCGLFSTSLKPYKGLNALI